MSAEVSRLEAFFTDYAVANADGTRSPSNIVAKNTSKKALIANTRMLAAVLRAAPTVSDEQRTQLGLPARDIEPSPRPTPMLAPTMTIESVIGHVVTVNLIDAATGRRCKPAGVDGAAVFTHVGDTKPTDSAAFKFEGNTSRARVVIEFPNTVPAGANVFITAFWFNERKHSGPGCDPISVNLGGGLAKAA